MAAPSVRATVSAAAPAVVATRPAFPAPAPAGRREPRAWHFALPIAVAIGAAVVAGRVHSSPEAREPARVAPAPAAEAALASAAAPPARPGAAAAASGAVVIARGDTLWDLAARHLGDARRWPSLHEANRAAIADPDLIYPGQELALPTR
jgi:nucleoid-associated protein YgaU